jgi:calcineurin-like phosphoesterase family protein
MDDYGQRQLFGQICNHIRDRTAQGYIVDFVFLTGDLANRGRAGEYADFVEAFLNPMLVALGGSSWDGRVFAVPGNHDVDRGRAPYFSRDEIFVSPARLFDPSPEGKLSREQFVLRFENYTDMDMSCAPSRWLESNEGAFSYNVGIRGSHIGIVGINTAWLCKDEEDRHRLSPGINLLNDALAKIKDVNIKIVLGHHPVSWMRDEHTQQVQVILGNHSDIYLHGHLHADDARYDDGGQGRFLGIRCGAAFQGRPEDKPSWQNGLMWAEVDSEKESIALEPFHWASHHREWKLTTDAFPNQYEEQGKWVFPLPGSHRKPRAAEVQRSRTSSNTDGAAQPEGLPPGWAFVNAQFLAARMEEETEERLLQFFDGRPPSWRLAMSPAISSRGLVSQVYARFSDLGDAVKPTVVNLLGPGGEGKSTAFLQTIVRLVRDDGWLVLWRYNELAQIDHKVIRRLTYEYSKLLVAVDEAHSLAATFATLVGQLGIRPPPHFLLCSRTIDWRAEVREMGSITSASNYQEITVRGVDRNDAALIVNSWARLGKSGMGALGDTDPDAAADQLMDASTNSEGEGEEGAFFGAMIKLRFGDKLKDRIRSVLYRIDEMRAPGHPIPEAYAMISAMHAEGLRFLSLPVLAEHFGMSQLEFHKTQ